MSQDLGDLPGAMSFKSGVWQVLHSSWETNWEQNPKARGSKREPVSTKPVSGESWCCIIMLERSLYWKIKIPIPKWGLCSVLRIQYCKSATYCKLFNSASGVWFCCNDFDSVTKRQEYVHQNETYFTKISPRRQKEGLGMHAQFVPFIEHLCHSRHDFIQCL